MTFDEQVKAAERRVREFDQSDGRKIRDPFTILSALESGLRHPETGAQYDALVMLREVVLASKGK